MYKPPLLIKSEAWDSDSGWSKGEVLVRMWVEPICSFREEAKGNQTESQARKFRNKRAVGKV